MKTWSSHEYNNGSNIVLHIMLCVPFFSRGFHKLFATIFSVLGFIEVSHCFFQFMMRNLIANTVWTNQNGSISGSIPRYYFDSRVRNNTTALCHSISKTSWHRESWLSWFLRPNPHWPNFFSCCSRLELVEDTSSSNDPLCFFRLIWFMICWELIYFKSNLMGCTLCKFVFTNIFEYKHRGVTNVCNN